MSAFLRSRMASTSKNIAASARLQTVSRHLSSTPPAAMEASKSDSITYGSDGSVRSYQLTRPKALNALNHEMISSLAQKVQTWRDSDLCKVVIGKGDQRAFCAGGDVKQLVLDLKDGKQTALPFFKDEFQLNWSIARLGKPYVAFMDGITMGGGCGIALPAPIRVATSRTHFAMPETKIGYAPDVGVNYYLAQLDGYIGAWLALTAQDVYGRAVYELGLATHYVQPERLVDVANEIQNLPIPSLSTVSSVVAASAPPSSAPSSINSKSNPDGHSPIKGEIRDFLDQTFKHDSLQKIYEGLEAAETDENLSEKVKAWAKEQKSLMDMRGPTGMAVALEGYRRAKQAKRLDITLRNDMAMATGFCGSKRATEDFVTGVTAVLVTRSKDRPEWSPSSISDSSLLPKKIVERFFDAKAPSSSERPSLDFKPEPSSKVSSGPDSTWGQFRRYGLPSEAEVQATVEGSAPGSGAFKVTTEELLERLLDNRNDAAGPRADEIRKHARDAVERLCEVKDNGYLDWKREKKDNKEE